MFENCKINNCTFIINQDTINLPLISWNANSSDTPEYHASPITSMQNLMKIGIDNYIENLLMGQVNKLIPDNYIPFYMMIGFKNCIIKNSKTGLLGDFCNMQWNGQMPSSYLCIYLNNSNIDEESLNKFLPNTPQVVADGTASASPSKTRQYGWAGSNAIYYQAGQPWFFNCLYPMLYLKNYNNEIGFTISGNQTIPYFILDDSYVKLNYPSNPPSEVYTYGNPTGSIFTGYIGDSFMTRDSSIKKLIDMNTRPLFINEGIGDVGYAFGLPPGVNYFYNINPKFKYTINCYIQGLGNTDFAFGLKGNMFIHGPMYIMDSILYYFTKFTDGIYKFTDYHYSQNVTLSNIKYYLPTNWLSSN